MFGKELIDSINNDSLKSTALELGETVLDSTLDDGIIKDIPLLGTIYSIYKTGQNIKDKYFLKKLLVFLKNTAEIDDDKREKFWKGINENPKEKEELGDKLIQLLDRVDEIKKAKWISFAFEELVYNRISKNDFHDLIFAIDNVKPHLAVIYYEYCIGYFDQKAEYLNHFLSIGLLYSNSLFRTSYMIKSQKITFKKPDIAEVFCSIIWKTEEEEIVQIHKNRILKNLQKRRKIDDKIKSNPLTKKSSIAELEDEIANLSNTEILEIKPTTNYTIISEKLAVIIDGEFAYYFEYSDWYNSGMIK